MLKKVNRISKRSEFDEIRKNGKMLGFSRFFGVVMVDKKDDELKFGVVISKKISKKAVERNKIKRRLMEILGRNMEMFKIGERVLFLAKKEMLGLKPKEIKEEIDKIISKQNPPPDKPVSSLDEGRKF